jgi:quinol monooxygenase YgiN
VVTVLFRAKVKQGKESEFSGLAKRMQDVSRTEDGCITFTYQQNRKDPWDFFLYEQWRDKDAIDAHVRNLETVLGPRREGDKFPEVLEHEMWESWTADLFDVVE